MVYTQFNFTDFDGITTNMHSFSLILGKGYGDLKISVEPEKIKPL